MFILLALLAGPARAQVDLPQANPVDSIVVSAQAANRWQQGVYEVWLLRGNCRIGQGPNSAQSNEAVLWVDRSDASGMAATPLAGGVRSQLEAGGTRGLELRAGGASAPPSASGLPVTGSAGWRPAPQRTKVIAYLEGNVSLDYRRGAPVRVADQAWFGRFFTSGNVEVQAGTVAGQPEVLPGVYQRGMERRNPAVADVVRQTGVEPAQFATPQPELPVGQPLPPGMRRIRVFPRGDVPVQAQWFPDPQTRQWIAVIDQGVNLIVDGINIAGPRGLSLNGSMDVSTDRLVLWTNSEKEPDLTGQTGQPEQAPLEIYMEGNIVFRQGGRTIYANRMYYDVRNQVGTVLDAEMLSPARNYEGLVRLRAEVLQQTGPDTFAGQNAFLTTSRLGVPRYRIQSGQINYQDIPHPVLDATGQPLLDPATGEPLVEHERLASARNNFLYLEDVPVFYWPTIATNLEESSFYIRRIRFRNDSVFGTQVLTNWNMYQVLGIRQAPAGTDWDASLDYMSKRGWGHGTTFLYHRPELFGIPGPVSGIAEYWGIFDNGVDNLGIDRPAVPPETDYRYRFLWQHRQKLAEGYQVTAEVGKISDRNFLQEYFQNEWDELKDQTTDLELRRTIENRSWNIFAQYRLNDFFTETNWLPRFDHFWLGQSVLNDSFTWYEHSSLGYAQLRAATLPNPADEPVYRAGTRLPWEQADAQGERLITRHELDWPIQLGTVKFVPYMMGELAHWGEDIAGNQLNRAYYQVGARASLPLWSVDPTVESTLWNVHGLAHKVEFRMEFLHAQANRPMTDLPLYDPVDDNSIEAFRRRFFAYQYGGVATPGSPYLKFDERFYALRNDLQGWVTAPNMEIADDLTALRLGVHQRWQTKRGMPDCRRVIDWIEFDTDMTFFPNPNRDNYGQVLGLWDYDLRWHVGDRLTLVSDGIFDFFGQGQKIVSVGAFLTRPPRGALYAGMRMVEGPISSDLLTFSYSYWMSPKWVSSLGISADLGDSKNFGQFLRVTRIGESLLVSLGFTADPSRNSYGVNFAIEPRLLRKGMLGQVGGGHIPVAGAYGLE